MDAQPGQPNRGRQAQLRRAQDHAASDDQLARNQLVDPIDEPERGAVWPALANCPHYQRASSPGGKGLSAVGPSNCVLEEMGLMFRRTLSLIGLLTAGLVLATGAAQAQDATPPPDLRA